MRVKKLCAQAVVSLAFATLAGCNGQIGQLPSGSGGSGNGSGSAGTGATGTGGAGNAVVTGTAGSGNTAGAGATGGTGGTAAPGSLDLSGSPKYYRVVRLSNASLGRLWVAQDGTRFIGGFGGVEPLELTKRLEKPETSFIERCRHFIRSLSNVQSSSASQDLQTQPT